VRALREGQRRQGEAATEAAVDSADTDEDGGMIKRLELAPELKLPAAEAVTQKYGFIGRSGSGKSYAAMRLAELFLDAGAQVIALDWVGIWWSLRLAAGGKAPGFRHVYIFGGEHADVPLEPTSGALMADLVVDKHISVVLDVMHFRKAERTRFATAFAEQFFHRKKTARTACHLFIEEAQAYLPQMVRGDEARMVGVFEDIGKVGRNYGIGNSLISQRPQAINKDVLNQIEVLLAFQTNGPQERKAIAGWTAENTDAGAAMIQELPKLTVGDALVWSPQWLRIAQRVHISERTTYNASSTPTQKAKAIKPKVLASADLEQLGEAMKASVEKAEASDPSKLKAKVAALQALLAKKEATLAEVDVRTKRIEEKLSAKTAKADQAAGKSANAELKGELVKYRRALEAAMKILVKVKAIDFEIETDEGRKALEQAIAAAVKQVTGPIEKRVTALVGRVEGFKLAAKHAEDEIAKLLDEKIDLTVSVQKREPFAVAAERPAAARRETVARRIVSAGDVADDTRLSNAKGELKKHVVGVLTALAQYGSRTRIQALILAGYQPSGDISAAFAAMLERGWVQTDGDRLAITDVGREALGPFEPLPTGKGLRDLIASKGSSAERKVLQALFDSYPTPATRSEICARAGLKPSGDISAAFGKFNRLAWLNERDGGLVVSDTFFEE
jgi:hypothetical protein